MDEHIITGRMDLTRTVLAKNAQVITGELEWLEQVIGIRLSLHFEQQSSYSSIEDAPAPEIATKEGSYAEFVKTHHLNVAERLLLILALVPHIRPGLLDVLLTKNHDYGQRYSEFGGVLSDDHTGLIPTAETAMFVLAGDNVYNRLLYQYLFLKDHFFSAKNVITGARHKNGSPRLSGSWMITAEYVDYLLCGEPYLPVYGEDFPAQLITTRMDWGDIVLHKKTRDHLHEIAEWIKHASYIMNELDLGKRLKPGYKTLFYGPPGTGKTLTAALLGKITQHPVYKVDLSMIVSKYIGETEKNLAKVFDHASERHWILFFDEADALFGKRTQVSTANDRYGNQEIGYLLQRIEDFPGVVILASNLKDNIDAAFSRRFQSIIEFRMPGAQERLQLWEHSFAAELPLDSAIDKRALAEKYELSGGIMMNVVRKATLMAITNGQQLIGLRDLEEVLRQELHKEGNILS
jgi:hypothetical protein